MRVGLISDPHGLLRPEALDFLRGSDAIVHAGDITGPEILAPLQAMSTHLLFLGLPSHHIHCH